MKEKHIKKNIKVTPVMKQYWEAKSSYPDSIMLFRMGDFYETFENDAKIASKILGITLSSIPKKLIIIDALPGNAFPTILFPLSLTWPPS